MRRVRFARLLLPLLARSVDVDEAVDRVLARMTDPRLRPECAATHGAWSAHDGLSVRTVEDALAGRRDVRQRYDFRFGANAGASAGAPAHAVAARATPLRHYGVPVHADDAGGAAARPLMYLAIPKTGSTTVRELVNRTETPRGGFALVDDPAFPRPALRAFTFVREPLERFLSAYGTFRARAPHTFPRDPWHGLCAAEGEVRCFEVFVDVITAQGDTLYAATSGANQNFDLAGHLMSQMWHIDAYPRRFDFVGRLETFADDRAAVARAFGLAALAPALGGGAPPQRHNVDEGRVDKATLRREAPAAIAKLVHHLRHDYACLGYPLPNASLPLAPG